MVNNNQDQCKSNLEVLQTDDENESCQTFVLKNEDHTLGNSLRHVIMQNPAVAFCGYTIPHPSENKIHLRIQTSGVSAASVLLKGFSDLRGMCLHAAKIFEEAVNDYKEKMDAE